MVFFYHCYRGAHLSIVAAALHLGKLDSRSGIKDILELEYFDKLQIQDLGIPVLAGRDQDNNPVYFLGLGRGSRIFARFAGSLTEELELKVEYKAVDCLPCLTPLIRIGGFISRYRPLRRIGRTLAAWGVHRNLRQIAALVLHARSN
ncbi:MAG: DUF3189 family protein [Bacillota bacterium]|jgi:hypothetical protein